MMETRAKPWCVLLIAAAFGLLAACENSSKTPASTGDKTGLEDGSADGGDQGETLAAQGKYCSATAQAAFVACGDGAQSDHANARGVCFNVSDDAERATCVADAETTRNDSLQLCQEQFDARLEVCTAIGEARYEPDFAPDAFDTDFRSLTSPNRFFPLGIGNRWEYGGSEDVVVEVLDQTKLIEGVTCIVVRDVVTRDGTVAEETADWFAQNKNGDVNYCGEDTREFETFEGDNPMTPELVSTEGSFKAGRDGDQTGIIFRAAPTVGEVYRQEFSLNNAEDLAEVLSISYRFGGDPELDTLVPQALADALCSAGDCVVTREFTPLAPDDVERKYYAPGIGNFLSVNLGTEEVVQLVGCNFDPRCAGLPAPASP